MLLAALPVSAQRVDTLRLSVEDAVAMALRNSDEVRLAAAQVDVADAQFGSARAGALPQIRLNSSYTHAFANARGQAVGQVFNQPNTYNVNLSVSQTLFQGGRVLAAARVASDTRQASRLDEEEARSLVTVGVQRAYLDVLFANRFVELQTDNVSLAASRVSQVEQLQQAGRSARYDVLRARVEHANLEPLLIQARNDRDLALLELKRLLNIPMERELQLTTIIDPAGVQAMLTSMSDTTVAPDRASIRSAEFEAHARRTGITIARGEFLPTATITFNTGYQAFPPRGSGFPDRFGEAANQYCAQGAPSTQQCQNGGWFSDRTINATISFPIFDGLRAKSNFDLARAQARLADVRLKQERERVAVEVARARAELDRARSLFNARQQTSAEAQEAFQLASLRFNRGLSTQLEVSDAQVALLTAQSVEARATYDLYLASAELARALGRPIPFPPSVPAQPIRRSDNGAQ